MEDRNPRYAPSNPVVPSNAELPKAPDLNFGYSPYLPAAADPYLGAQAPGSPDWTGSYRPAGAPDPVSQSFAPTLPGAPDPVVGSYTSSLPGAPELSQRIAAPPAPEPPRFVTPESPAVQAEPPQVTQWQLHEADLHRNDTHWR